MDLSWSELLVVGIVALIIIGPKDLPGMFRELGRFTAKIRAMGREFSRAMEQAAKESGVQDVANDLRKATSPKSMGLDAVKSVADRFEKWDPMKNTGGPAATQRPTAPAPASAAPSSAPVAAPVVAAPVAAAVPPAAAAPVPAGAGPNTAALYEKQAARKAVLDEAAEKLRAIANPAPAAPETPVAPARKPGRRRAKPETSGGEEA